MEFNISFVKENAIHVVPISIGEINSIFDLASSLKQNTIIHIITI